MSFSKKQNIIFYIALTLSAFQLIQYRINGGVFLTLLAGLVPFLLWSTRKKLLSNLRIGGFDKVMSYLVIVYAAFAGLIAVLVFVFWLMSASIDADIIESAMADNPAINNLNEEELKALNQVMENLPSLCLCFGCFRFTIVFVPLLWDWGDSKNIQLNHLLKSDVWGIDFDDKFFKLFFKVFKIFCYKFRTFCSTCAQPKKHSSAKHVF